MGMELYRIKDKNYFRWSIHHWAAVLELAQGYGWEPKWTKKSEDSECDENYMQNVYQVVADEDAGAMAAALEKALPDIPGQEAIIYKTINPQICAEFNLSEPMTVDDYVRILLKRPKVDGPRMIVGGFFTTEIWETLNCFEKLAAVKSKLKDFIVYLRGGAFEIR